MKDSIRNFSIIAHIDHGKSTLADRLLQLTGAIDKRQFKDQLLDDMELERERGITIKASTVKLSYKAKDGKTYMLNLIDTPGHVDFTYEVSKSIAACEGAILIVDAAQGVQAQTVANLYLALEHNITIIPVINKIDLANAEVEKVRKQISDILGLDQEEIILASAKENIGTTDILERIVEKVPPPAGSDDQPLQALIFDSTYDTYRGVIVYIKVTNGIIKNGMKVKTMGRNTPYDVKELGIFRPKPEVAQELHCGEVGYITCGIKDAKEIVIGDTITSFDNPAASPLPGYEKISPMVYCGIYPVNSKDFKDLKDAMEKMKLQDASFIYEPESSASLGFGFRCGFLGLLHMEIIQERLQREYDLNLVITTPSVIYKVKMKSGGTMDVDNPTKLPSTQEIEYIEEPFVRAYIMLPKEAMGSILDLAESKRGYYISTEYMGTDTVQLVYELPLSEVIVDFYDKIKSLTRGYGSLNYEFLDYRKTNIVKLDILINGKLCDALSSMVHKDRAYQKGRLLAEKLKELIPKQLYKVAVQAAIGGQVIAREDIRSLGKHVTSKCYGGDITRKRKLWEKQKRGKKRMKQIGEVQIPQEAFIAALKL